MKRIRIITLLFLSACGQTGPVEESENNEIADLPKEIISTNEGLDALKESIYSDFPNLEKEMEVLEFDYYCSYSSSDDELSSSMDLQFVKGDDKNKIVEYSIDNEGSLSTSEIEISTGNIGNEKISNSYETYQSFLFSSKSIDLDVIRRCITSSLEQFKIDANCPDAFCKSAKIEYDNRGDLELSIRIEQKAFMRAISRSYDWTIEGEQKK